MIEFLGFIESITFLSEENGFSVFKFQPENQKNPFTATGIFSSLEAGETLKIFGSWHVDPKHGQQFKVESHQKCAPNTLIGIEKYLGSGLIKGIGPRYAKKIVDKFGLDTLHVIEHMPKKLLEVQSLGKKRMNIIHQCFEEQKSISEVMVFLQGNGVTPAYAQKIFKSYGHNCIEKVKNNPYLLARDIRGIGYKHADKIAQNLGIKKDAHYRIDAAIEYLLLELSSEGHTCYPKDSLLELATNLLEVDLKKVDERTFSLHSEKRIVLSIHEKTEFIAISSLYFAEKAIVKEINRIKETSCSIRDVQIQNALKWIQQKIYIKFAKNQKEAIEKALSEKLLIITGGPGTGKSTITKAIIQIVEKLSCKILLAAPTGRAAKRMTEITHRFAQTIHSLLEPDFQNQRFKKDQDNPLKCDLIIIDEASMIDTYLMQSLLKAIPSRARVIFIGDIDQLPSVGPGNVLRDLIQSEKLSVASLKFIFRQAKGSKIITNAHLINAGYFPNLKKEKGDDFFFIEKEDPEEVLSEILNLVSLRLPNFYNFDPNRDIQVLAPMKRGIIGIDNLNFNLQKKLNSNKKIPLRMGREFAVYDKVMQTKNHPKKGLSNGDIGIITSINQVEQELEINFDGKVISFGFNEIDDLTLCYAASIHKYQGSESKCIVMPIHTHHFKLLHRNLFYTGITRAKKLVVIVGTKKAIAIAVKNDEVKKRYTALFSSLTEKSKIVTV